MERAGGEGNSGYGSKFTHGLAVGCERRARGGKFSFQPETVKGAVYVAAGADALDDFLPQVAAFGEVESVGLGGLLRKVAIADVYAEAWSAFEEAKGFEGFGADGESTSFGESLLEEGNGAGSRPELVAGDERALGVDEIDWRAMPEDSEERERAFRDWEADLGEESGGFRSGETNTAARDCGEFYVVHDDKAVEKGEDVVCLCASGFEEDAFWRGEGGGDALDAPLGVKEEVEAALTGGEILNGIGDHAVEPANAVFAGDLDPAEIVQWKDDGVMDQGVQLCNGVEMGNDIGHARCVD